MDPVIVVVAATLIFLVAVLYSNLGMGGGQLYVPILLTFITPLKEVAVPMSLTFTIATALPAVWNHHRERLVAGRLAAPLLAGALAGALVGVLFTLAISPAVFLAFFSAVLVLVGLKMLWDWLGMLETLEADDDGKMTRPRLAGSSLATLSSGFLSGSMGIGGGIANVPILVYLLGRRSRLAIGTSTLMIIPVATLGFLGFLAFSPTPLDFPLLALFWPLVLVGSYFGSRWGLAKLRSRSVALAFILVLFVAAAKLVLDLAGVT